MLSLLTDLDLKSKQNKSKDLTVTGGLCVRPVGERRLTGAGDR
jgi:hypothetical protein